MSNSLPSSRLRRFFQLHLPLAVLSGILLLAVATVSFYEFASSATFENFLRERLVVGLETATGGRVEIAAFHWNLLHLEAEVDGLVLHGLEAPTVAPLARIEHLQLKISILNLFSPRILLRDLEISRPQIHLIVSRDGTTNLPQPRHASHSGKPVLEQLFNLEAGQIAVTQGLVHYENQAAAFDFQNRFLPLDFVASDLAVKMSYLPAAAAKPESYRIEAQAADWNLVRGTSEKRSKKSLSAVPVHGHFQAILDLTHNQATLQSLEITSESANTQAHSLKISGTIQDFSHPRWQAQALGELDMRLLEPITGYPDAPDGIAHLDLNADNRSATFRIDGSVHIANGSYIGTGVVATGLQLDAHVHADPAQLLITSILARLRQGGQMEGTVALDHWLPPGNATADTTIPVNGKVSANFRNVSLDAVMDMVGERPFLRLGFNALISGPATALWTDGDVRTLSVAALLAMQPSANPIPAESPANGTIDATYTQRDGAVDLRQLDLQLPSSHVLAHGRLGAYPLTSASHLNVDLTTGNLSEFDAVLRDLGLSRNGKTGAAALPIALAGQAEFHGTWSGSIVDPRLEGQAKATQLSVEVPPIQSVAASQSQFLRWDSAEATGSYSATRIDITHGLLRRGKTELALDGSLIATPNSASTGTAPDPVYDANSQLHLRLRTSQVAMSDLLPLTGQNLPISGILNGEFVADGTVNAPHGSGWAELSEATIYGEPVKSIRAKGTLDGSEFKLASVAVHHASGNLTASGSFDLNSHRFQLDAQGAALDLSRIAWQQQHGLAALGTLRFMLAGSGTPDDPQLQLHANVANFALGGESLHQVALEAHTSHRTVTYELTSGDKAATLLAHGQTALSGDYATQARVDLSRFPIDSLLQMTSFKGLNGDSALTGTITLSGPLAHPEKLVGEARLQELAVSVSGVALKNDSVVHLSLANNRIALDLLHITGEGTDLRLQGTVALDGNRQLDLTAIGTTNLKLVESFEPDLSASGTASFQVAVRGSLQKPDFEGHIAIQNGSLALDGLANGLSQINGTLEFNRDRLEVQSLIAMSGGGQLSVTGNLAYQRGLYADLAAIGNGIRIRYPEGVSSLADAKLRLTGNLNNLLLAGNVLITRFTISPDLDMAALAAQANAPRSITPADAPTNRVHLDVHLVSSPQLSFQNAIAKLAGNANLHLRGTLAEPSLLGRISITEGSANIAGTRYDLQHGEIDFNNPLRIQPTIDLNATARVEDYDISLGLHGTPDKMAVSYRSDPPLPESDVIALLAIGRTGNQQRLYTQQQEQSGTNTDALLGGALNYTMSSRVQRLFGASSVKLDPNYLGALGNATSRVIVEEQLGRNLTLTYATNVNTTSQQLIQAEVAINRHVSLLVAKDESGVFSMVLKATRRYR